MHGPHVPTTNLVGTSLIEIWRKIAQEFAIKYLKILGNLIVDVTNIL